MSATDEEEIATPCKGICKMHPKIHVCIGCYRSPLELRLWSCADNTTKKNILNSIRRKRKLFGDLIE